ncbi:MAG: shikimate dehydrogenase family protein [Candidatus Cryptobacteroides sp.]
MAENRKFGLIGHPIAHSQSPALFRAGYRGKYAYDLIEGEVFEDSYRRFLEEYAGINVTAPFKGDAYRMTDIRSRECERVGATNLLLKTDEGIKGYNTDYYGVALTLLSAVRTVSGESSPRDLPARPSPEQMREALGGKVRKALVVGCGGAGKAAAAAVADMGLETTLMNRTAEKAEALAASLSDSNVKVLPISNLVEAVAQNDITVYTLPAPTGQEALLKGCFRSGDRKILIEANYRDPVLKEILEGVHGCTYVHGRQWLLYQAYAGYDLFTGEEPSLEQMTSIL